jgi:calcium-translocating P-type ATPase
MAFAALVHVRVRIDQLSIEGAIAALSSGADGLAAAEAERRLREYGPNRIEPPKRESPALRFAKELTQFFAIILWIAAALSFAGEYWEPGQGMAKIGFVLIAVIVTSAVFSFWQEFRAERTLAALQKLLPQRVDVVRDGRTQRLAAEQLVPGDVVLLSQGDDIPADCRLIEAFGVQVNISTISGEAAPLVRDAKPSASERLVDASNLLFAGTSLVAGEAKAIVFATGMRSEFGNIARLTQAGISTVSPLRVEVGRLSRVIAMLAIAIGVVFYTIASAIGVPPWQGFLFAIGLIVAMVPEGLLPTLTLALVLATQRMAKRNVLIRHLPSVEALGSTTVICTDKTGTLTQNRMRLARLLVGMEAVDAEDVARTKALADRHAPFFHAAALCHDVKDAQTNVGEALLGDPMEIALVAMARRALAAAPAAPRLDELPFDADRMRLSVVHASANGATLYCKGASETVLPLCTRLCVDGDVRPLSPELRRRVIDAQEAMAADGLRVLAVAYRVLDAGWHRDELESDLVFAGLAAFDDPPRPEVAGAIRTCREAGIRVIMVTGDHPRTALAIARGVGLVRGDAVLTVTGDQIRAWSSAQLQLALDAPDIVFARVSAEDKRRIVDALREKRHIVAVTGDGVNDAPALRSAHIGIAMGLSGTDVAKAAADMVLLDDNFASIVAAVEEGRAVFANIRKFLTYILTHNVAELVPYIAFVLFRIPLPLTPIQILCVDMGSDSLTGLGLGVERPDPDGMRRPPRPAGEPLLDLSLGLRAYLFLGLFEAAAAMAAFFFVLHGGGWRYGTTLASADPLYLRATTACLAAIIVIQIANVFLCRSEVRSLREVGVRGNPLILWGVAVEIALIALIAYTPVGNALIATAPLGADFWLFIGPFAAAIVLIEEVRKAIVRRARRHAATSAKPEPAAPKAQTPRKAAVT